jgi:hypothetical protein
MKNNSKIKPKIKVTPTNVTTGSKAPYYIIDVSTSDKVEQQYKSAVEEAKKHSALSKLKTFTFIPSRI